MLENLGVALQITVLGMGLVFGAILLLWGSITLLVRLTTDKPLAKTEHSPGISTNLELKRRAAAVAVAVALEQAARESAPIFPLPRMQPISHWQAALRSRQMEQRGRPR
jgi:Na+-transporting methylmalonyl-CoA/oxaloacetate decarboxylase gamma subunit